MKDKGILKLIGVIAVITIAIAYGKYQEREIEKAETRYREERKQRIEAMDYNSEINRLYMLKRK